MKRIVALILALIMTVSLFALPVGASTYAKGDTNGDGAVDSADAVYLLYHVLFGNTRYPLAGEEGWVEPDESENDKILDLETKDLGGHEFRFLARRSSHYHLDTHEIYAEKLTGDTINDAVYNRNDRIEKIYNCKIVEEKTSSPAAAALDPLIAGEYLVDFLFDEARLLKTLAASNLLTDLSKVQNMNLKKVWYDKEGMDGLNIGGKVFFATGDGCILDDTSTYILRFNKDFIYEYDSDIDLYDEVIAGKWTVDRMYELMIATAKDLNDDGILMPDEDRFGYNGEMAMNWAHVAACGVTLSTTDGLGGIEIPLTPKQELLDVWAALRTFLTSQTRLNQDGGLAEGLCTFTGCGISSLLNAKNSTYNFGVLPLPKFSEDQDKYYTTVYFSQLCSYSIPKTVNNAQDYTYNGFSSGVEQAAYFLEVFFYYSMKYLTPVFYNEVLLKEAVPDSGSGEMIKIALENRIYDPVVGYDFGTIDVFDIAGSVQNGIPGTDINYDFFVSAYESRVSAARKALNNYIQFINSED